MSERGSFWSTMPGFVTGAAGLLTALVGLLGLSVQLGWIGGGTGGSDAGGGNATTTSSSTVPGSSTTRAIGSGTTVPGSSAGAGASGSSASSGAAQFTVDPTNIDFAVFGSPQATIKVRNTGEVPLTVKTPTVSGAGSVHFVAGDVSCTREPLQPGRSCDVQVAFAPKAAGAVSAVVVIAANEATRQVEVQVKGNKLL